MFGPKRYEMTGCGRRMGNEKLYFSQSIIRMIISRKIRCTGHAARKGPNIHAHRFLVEKSEGGTTMMT
jgi:hypothetical protein